MQLEPLEYSSRPAEKQQSVFEGQNLVFAGCSCTAGEGLGLAVRTGNQTVGQVALLRPISYSKRFQRGQSRQNRAYFLNYRQNCAHFINRVGFGPFQSPPHAVVCLLRNTDHQLGRLTLVST